MTEDNQILRELAQELAEETGVPVQDVTIHLCGCGACQHDHKGQWVVLEHGGGSSSCSKCGSLSIDRAMLEY